MVFIETTLFTKLISSYLNDDEYTAFQLFLKDNPDFGDVIPQSGGLRKVRWAQKGRGKSGGVRIIYFFKKSDSEIWLLTLYSKSEQSNISPEVLRKIARELSDDKA